MSEFVILNRVGNNERIIVRKEEIRFIAPSHYDYDAGVKSRASLKCFEGVEQLLTDSFDDLALLLDAKGVEKAEEQEWQGNPV